MSSAGPSALRSQKGLLTRYCNNLKHLIDSFESQLDPNVPTSRDLSNFEETQAFVFELQDTSDLVYSTLGLFTSTVDALEDGLDEEQEKQVAQYIDTAHSAIDRANRLSIQLTARLRSARGQQSIGGDAMNSPPANLTLAQPDIGILQPAQPRLPPIPIPRFSGKVWEFKNFWRIFCANVHDQPLTNLQKFNYLLHSLQGEARDVIKRYAVTDNNYNDAISLLQAKYGDSSKLIDALQRRLESAKADSPGIHSQRRLLEYLIPTISQLEKEKVNLNGSYLVRKVLAKFSTSLQRTVLTTLLSKNISETEWRMQDAITLLDQLINTEERINDMTARDTRNTRDNDAQDGIAEASTVQQDLEYPHARNVEADEQQEETAMANNSDASEEPVFMEMPRDLDREYPENEEAMDRNVDTHEEQAEVERAPNFDAEEAEVEVIQQNQNVEHENQMAIQEEQERIVIEQNAEFLESIDELGEAVLEPEDNLVMVDEVENDADDADDGNSNNENRSDVQEPTPSPSPPTIRDEIQDLQQQLRQARQLKEDYKMRMDNLESEPQCRLRHFSRGYIRNLDEERMPCVFCGRIGEHYSDSCRIFRLVDERRERLLREGRCSMCLDNFCERGRACRKFRAKCFYCRRTGHNSAVCTLPEKSRRIQDELESLRREYEDVSTRIHQLRRTIIRKLRRNRSEA